MTKQPIKSVYVAKSTAADSILVTLSVTLRLVAFLGLAAAPNRVSRRLDTNANTLRYTAQRHTVVTGD